MKENNAKYIILGILNHEPMTGYDIKKRIQIAIHHFWDVSYGQIYPTLKQLKKDGQVNIRSEKTARTPERKVYSLTPAGRETLHAWLAKPVAREKFKLELLLKLFFSGAMSSAVPIEHIQQFKMRQTKQRELFRLFAKELKGSIDGQPDHLHYYLAVLLGQKISDACIQWAEAATTILEQPEMLSPGRRKPPKLP